MKDPMVDVGNVRNLVCAWHETALARDPSVNAIAYPLAVLQEAFADPRTMTACHAGTDEEDIALAGPFLRSVAPVCEWLSVEARRRAWAEARAQGRGARA